MPQIDIDIPGILERVSAFLQLAGLCMGIVLTALWLAIIVWTYQDIRSRSRDWLLIILAVALVTFVPVLGLLMYLLMRPKQSLAEQYDRALEEEALLQALEERVTCPKCHSRVEKDYVLCPTCYTPLRKPCPECSRLLALEWDVCPYCGHMSETAASRAAPQPSAAPPGAAPSG